MAKSWLLAALVICSHAANAARCPQWPEWQRFVTHYVSDDGRVIDASSSARISTSEGQSYALLFALAANDRARFAQLLTWTENNLAQGDLTQHLPAWLWGRDAHGQWTVLDDNAASDADVWIAYTLGEAARLWRVPAYQRLAEQLAARILHYEVAWVPGLGQTLLPGPKGFVSNDTWRFNASYLPLPVLQRLADTQHPLWRSVQATAEKMIDASTPNGLASDWIEYRDGQFHTDRRSHGIGSYDAIRVYLWAGMMADAAPRRAQLQNRLSPVLRQFETTNIPAEKIDTRTGEFSGAGSVGFSAALIPLLSSKQATALNAQLARARGALVDDQHYYSDVLSLFGLGWFDGWLRFAADGQLQPKWSRSCTG